MTPERFKRVSEVRKRYLSNIYRTRRSQRDRKAIRGSLKAGGQSLSDAMNAIMDRKYERNAYMGLNQG